MNNDLGILICAQNHGNGNEKFNLIFNFKMKFLRLCVKLEYYKINSTVNCFRQNVYLEQLPFTFNG